MLAFGTLVSACATTGTAGLTARFVRQGVPAVDLGGTPPTVKIRRADYKSGPTPGDIRYVTRTTGTQLTAVETRDAGLREALLAVSVHPSLDTHLDVARAYRRLGILDKAYDHLTAGVKLSKTSAALHDALARVWRDWGLPHLGLADAYRAVAFAPGSAIAKNTLGMVLYGMGRREEARTAFREAVALEPRASYALNNLCYLALVDGRSSEAIGYCRQALGIEPTLSVAKVNLSWATAQSMGIRAAPAAGAAASVARTGPRDERDYYRGVVLSSYRSATTPPFAQLARPPRGEPAGATTVADASAPQDRR